MLKKITFSLMLLMAVGAQARPAAAQALLPYTLPLDEARLQADGQSLARDAALQAQFRQYDEALARAQLAAQLLPSDPNVLTLLGSLYLQASEPQPDKAIETLNRARSLQPDNAPVLFALGSAYFSQSLYTDAIASIEAGLAIEPDTAGALFDLGNAHYKLKQYSKAIAHYEEAIEKDENFWPAVNNIGLVKYEAGDVSGAIAKWEEALVLAGTEETEPQLAIAVAQFTQGTRTLAVSNSAIAALERNPRYARIPYLEENLWGEQLIADTQTFFATPPLQELLRAL